MKSDIFPAHKLGFGCMRLPLRDPHDPQSVDLEQFKQMVDVFVEGGGTYFDTAFAYLEGASERALRKALVERYPRESYTIATKCRAWSIESAEVAQRNLSGSLERMGLDYVDFYLLHNLGGARTPVFEEYGMWDFVREQKAAGKIRNWGFSLHDGPEALEDLLTQHPDVDFVQLQVNYMDWEDPLVQSRRCLEVAQVHNVPVVIMEPVRGGCLANLPEVAAAPLLACRPDASLASWGYRFCYDIPNIMTVLSGASTLEQMQQNVAEFKAHTPLSEEERQAIASSLEILQSLGTIACTNCQYCVKDCPQGVVIPDILSLLNLETVSKRTSFVKLLYSRQAAAGPASSCIACGACEDMCPQQIDIINQLKVAAELFE